MHIYMALIIMIILTTIDNNITINDYVNILKIVKMIIEIKKDVRMGTVTVKIKLI